MKKRYQKGFTLAELLIVVAIIAVLVAISIPIFTSQLEKSREAVDLANVRSAYAQVMNAAIIEDTLSPLYSNGEYQMVVPLKQTQRGWTMDEDKLVIGGISKNTPQVEGKQPQWRGTPKANGKCRVYVSEGVAYLNWGGEDHINTVSAADFLTKDILENVLGTGYKHTVVNSNEPYGQGEGTKAFLDYAKKNGFDLEDYGAKSWQMYVKSNGQFLTKPAIYWSTVDMTDDTVGKFIPVIGYRDGKYDVYRAKVVTYNENTTNQYNSLSIGFANITEGEDGLGGSATFQFNNYEDAKKAYDKIMALYEEKKDLSSVDMSKYGL